MRAAAVVLLAACTHERPISTLHELAGEDIEIETSTGERASVHVIAGEGGLKFLGEGGFVPPANVERAIDVRRGQGALEGLGLGALTGVVVGAAIGYADGDDTCADDHSWCLFTLSAGDKAALGGILLGGLGGIVGALIGYGRGSRYIYSHGEQIRVMPSGPPGAVGGVTVTF